METRLFGTFIKFFLIFMQDSGDNKRPAIKPVEKQESGRRARRAAFDSLRIHVACEIKNESGLAAESTPMLHKKDGKKLKKIFAH
jgi:hypothetical protein